MEAILPPSPPSAKVRLLDLSYFQTILLCACKRRCLPSCTRASQDVKVAVAGLSDDPLSMMMQERAVARNMSRHGGES